MSAAARTRPLAVLLTIGDELLLGDRVDTNGPWLGRLLTDAGFEVVERWSVGDSVPAIRGALARMEALAPGGVLVATGGLGPTDDDCTRQGVAAHLGIPLEEDPRLLQALEARSRARGSGELSRLNRRLALVPKGAEQLTNPVGSAPGLLFHPSEGSGTLMAFLPGVPREMRAMAETALLPGLRRAFAHRLHPPFERIILTAGQPESLLAELLEPALPPSLGVRIQYRPSLAGVELRFSAEGEGGEARMDEALERLEPLLAPWRYGWGGETPEGATVLALRRAGLTLALAESCTGGLLASRLTAAPGCSKVFQGGVVAYDNSLKEALLGVTPELLEEHGAVSGPVAMAMAEGVRIRLGADLGLSITGVAGPGGGSAHRPVGTVWFGFSGFLLGENRRATIEAEPMFFPGDRDEIRTRAVHYALRRVRERTRG
jgi:nicotinamide-nucleotide amidase